MMTRIVPQQIKAIIWVLVFVLAFYFIFVQKASLAKDQKVLSSTESTPKLIRKTIANGRQITIQLFSPVIEAEAVLPIVRFVGDKPYYDEMGKK